MTAEATLINLELNKSIEAKRLNKRTGSPTTGPEVVIPYGAMVKNVEPDRDMERFTYLGELYWCPHTLLASATDPQAWNAQQSPAAESPASSGPNEPYACRTQAGMDGGIIEPAAAAACQGARRMANRRGFRNGPRVLPGPQPPVGRDVVGVRPWRLGRKYLRAYQR